MVEDALDKLEKNSESEDVVEVSGGTSESAGSWDLMLNDDSDNDDDQDVDYSPISWSLR